MPASVDDRELVFRFFVTFVRFEYAMKAAGLLQRARASGAAEAKWSEVAAKLKNSVDGDKRRLRAAAGILLQHPPRRQVVEHQGGSDVLAWRIAGSAGDEIDNLIAALKRVRNNLFHGGKETDSGHLSARGCDLVSAANAVLEELLRTPALKAVADAFHTETSEPWT
jgi:hypothetical protein